ncbi:MAG: 50S ribosomal protein L33 [Candidatus Pacebacteria bacterium]|nr:50S ribosomal protein L33 [Candidatus Paceibacterota bacterium]
MAVKKKPAVKLQCQECKRVNYFTKKSGKPTDPTVRKLELKKFCKWDRKHTLHKEAKK